MYIKVSLFWPNLLVSHQSVIVSWHDRYQDSETEASKWNSVIINLHLCISYCETYNYAFYQTGTVHMDVNPTVDSYSSHSHIFVSSSLFQFYHHKKVEISPNLFKCCYKFIVCSYHCSHSFVSSRWWLLTESCRHFSGLTTTPSPLFLCILLNGSYQIICGSLLQSCMKLVYILFRFS